MPPTFSTERLLARSFTENDFGLLRSLHTDLRVMEYISGATRTEDETRKGIALMQQIEKENPLLGAWVIELRATGKPVGNVILRVPATQEKIEGHEIGYSFLHDDWGKGYATESCRGLIEYAFRELPTPSLAALIHPDHETSRKVLMKLGFQASKRVTFVNPTTGASSPSDLLELRRSDYDAQ